MLLTFFYENVLIKRLILLNVLQETLTSNNLIFTMTRPMFAFTKSILERVSFDPLLFCKELEKAIRSLLPYEIEQLTEWLLSYTVEKPELKQCLIIVNK